MTLLTKEEREWIESDLGENAVTVVRFESARRLLEAYDEAVKQLAEWEARAVFFKDAAIRAAQLVDGR